MDAPARSMQVDDGDFTRLHNAILERLALARLTASEYRCLMFLFRRTYGWQKKEDTISLSQWAEGVGIAEDKRHNVLRTLQGLVAKKVILMRSNGNNRPATWSFNKYFDQWDAALFPETVIFPDNTTVIAEDNTSAMQADNSFAPTVITQDNKTVIGCDNHKRKKESYIAAAAADPPQHRSVDATYAAFVAAYERIWGLLIDSEYRGEQIELWSKRLLPDAWEFCLKEAADHRKIGNWRYLERILQRVWADGPPVSAQATLPPTGPKVIAVPKAAQGCYA